MKKSVVSGLNNRAVGSLWSQRGWNNCCRQGGSSRQKGPRLLGPDSTSSLRCFAPSTSPICCNFVIDALPLLKLTARTRPPLKPGGSARSRQRCFISSVKTAAEDWVVGNGFISEAAPHPRPPKHTPRDEERRARLQWERLYRGKRGLLRQHLQGGP